ncbi:Peptide-N4-(N-acetyl-beta-glucosaminyl)asparagineamidase A [Linum grandiflorum]
MVLPPSLCCCFTLLFFFFLILIHQPFPSSANLHTINTIPLLKSSLRSPPSTTQSTAANSEAAPPTVFFEVTKPISVPKTQPCKHLILQHDFGFTYSKPPVTADYSFPSHCPRDFSKAVLEWNATCKGRQFDRIFGVWLAGVELLRSCTAEPRPNGIFWTVKKDITRYSSLLLSNDTLEFAVFLGNIIDATYTGIYHVNLSIYFYPDHESGGNARFSKKDSADLILPISRDRPLNDGLWFEIQNSNHTEWKEFVIPSNVRRAVLEVYVSFHENDEFWFTNFPRSLLDGKSHRLGFSVTNALNVWFVDANLHLWLDHQSVKTEGLLLNRHDQLDISSQTNFKGLDGKFLTGATRSVSSKGWLKSSMGNITTHFRQRFSYNNVMELGKDADLQTVMQVILSNDSVSFESLSSRAESFGSRCNFSLDFYSDFKEQPNNTGLYIINLTLGFDRKNHDSAQSTGSSLRNRQSGQSVMLVKNNLVVSGVGATQQVYKYDSSKSCYFRNISSFNYTILFDKEVNTCSREKHPYLGLQATKLWPFPSRRSLSSSSVLPDRH